MADDPTEYRVELSMKPPSRLAVAWYRRLGSTPPLSEASTGPRHAELARLVPYEYRAFHRGYAAAHGFFWLPCPLCDRPFGGHESGDSIPDPTRDPNSGLSICSQCTIKRNRETDHA
jgi:hypothetical protein